MQFWKSDIWLLLTNLAKHLEGKNPLTFLKHMLAHIFTLTLGYDHVAAAYHENIIQHTANIVYIGNELLAQDIKQIVTLQMNKFNLGTFENSYTMWVMHLN